MRPSVACSGSTPLRSSVSAQRSIVHTADTASFQPIFLPSLYERPLYEIGTS